MKLTRWTLPIFLLLSATCGGKVVVEVSGGGGAGGASSSTSTSTAVTTGPGPCSSHDQCPGGLCIFATGQCAPACSPGTCDTCGPGSFCEPCPTSSCPKCDDCRAACVPVTPGRCDDDDPCPAGNVCLWTPGACAPACGPNGECDDFSVCDECASSSCCGCRNCLSACLGAL